MNVSVEGLITTIIPVFNRPQMILRAVNSVLDQTYSNYEIIIVDDGSTDQTGEVVDQIHRQYPEVISVLHVENGGPGLAREHGRLAARGEFIQYLDSDDWLLPNKFEDQIYALRQNTDCGIAYGVTRLVGPEGEIYQEESKSTGKNHEYLFPALLVDRWWHTHTPIYRRTVSDQAGAWPRQRPEDWDLEARMGALGVKLVHCGTTVSCQLYHDSPNRVSHGDKREYLLDEAWFLPRLYQCALQAGVSPDSVEMKHFARWAFMCARHLGAAGEEELAERIYGVARTASNSFSPSLTTAGMLANIFGWKVVGRMGSLKDRLLP